MLSIVIVNWNSKDYLRSCIASIRANTRSTPYEVVVIDAGSFDGSAEMLSEEFPDVHFIQSPDNLGFARANNRAVDETSGDLLLFLNPDTELKGPAIDVMYSQLMVLPSAGAVGCRLLNADGSLQTSCVQSIPTILNQLLDSELLRALVPRSSLWGTRALHDGSSHACHIQAVSGACLMIKRAVFEGIGRFSEDYFMYAEDIDLCDKAIRAGYLNYHVPSAIVVHYGGSSSRQAVSAFTAVMMPEAILRFLRKTRGRAYGWAYRIAMLASAAGRLALLAIARLVGRSVDASLQKWVAVLRWSLGCDGIVSRYYGAAAPRSVVDV